MHHSDAIDIQVMDNLANNNLGSNLPEVSLSFRLCIGVSLVLWWRPFKTCSFFLDLGYIKCVDVYVYV